MVKFQNIAIISKIAVPATIVASVAIAIVLSASFAVTHLSDTATTLVDKNAARVEYSLEAESYFNSAAVSEKNVMLAAATRSRRATTSPSTTRPPRRPWTPYPVSRPSPTLRTSTP
jgi:hypothetical protein